MSGIVRGWVLGALTYVVALVGVAALLGGLAGDGAPFALLLVMPGVAAGLVAVLGAPPSARGGAGDGVVLAAPIVVVPAVLQVMTLMRATTTLPIGSVVMPVLVPLLVLAATGALASRASSDVRDGAR